MSTPEDDSGSEESPSEQRSTNEFWRLMTRYAPALGLLPGSVGAGYLIGYLLDYFFSTTYLRVVFMGIGIVSGIIQLMRLLSRDAK